MAPVILRTCSLRLLLFILAILIHTCDAIPEEAQAAAPTVTYAIGPPSVPLYEPDSANQIGWKGLFVEVVEEIFTKELGCNLIVAQYPWKRAQQNVKEGVADVTVSIPTADRLEYALKSEKPILKMYLHVYTYAGHPKLAQIRKIRTVQDIIDLKLKPVTNLGNGWHKENIEDAGVTTFYVPNDENIPQFLALKRADIMIDSPLFMNNQIAQYNLGAKLVMTEALFGPLYFHLLVSKNSRFARLMPSIDKAIDRLERQGRLEAMTSQYSHF